MTSNIASMKTSLLFSILFLLSMIILVVNLVLLQRALARSSCRSSEKLTSSHITPEQRSTAAAATDREPLILIYNPLYNAKDWYSPWISVSQSSAIKTLQNCPTECHFTFDEYFVRFADYVLVSISGFEEPWHNVKPFCFLVSPRNRTHCKKSQIWIAYNAEPPCSPHAQRYEVVDDYFHWFATYRRDSDIFLPYGRFHQLSEPRQVSLDDIRSSLSQKKLAAWLVSNCAFFVDAKAREILVKTLQRFIPVDTFGQCSGIKCPETPTLPCRAYLGQHYKFYLAFENSLCQEYVTEKFFQAFNHGMVPVVFGLANYSHFAPPGSYINALDYNSVEDLAQHLLFLDQNDDEYLRYFAWRGKFAIESLSAQKHMCILCQKLKAHYFQKKEDDKRGEIGVAQLEQSGLQQKQQVIKHPSYKRWHNSFPNGLSQSTLLHIGNRIVLNATQVCLRYDQHPDLHNWLLGL